MASQSASTTHGAGSSNVQATSLLNLHFQQVGRCCQSEEQDSLRHLRDVYVFKGSLGRSRAQTTQIGLENPIDFEEEILDAEVQQNKAIPLSEEEIALDVASSEGTMSGSGSGGENVDYDMPNYGYDDYE
nr:hypothetical protein [Tanacetum cinerariifolium]